MTQVYQFFETQVFLPGEEEALIYYPEASPLFFQKGERIQIFSPSGGGKTIFFHLLKGLEEELGFGVIGAPHFFLEQEKPYESVYLLTQNPEDSLLCLSVLEEIEVLFGYRKDPATALLKSRLIETCGLSHLLNRKVFSLSSGEKRRFQIAFLLVKKACVYLLDEPFSHLDTATKSWAMGILKGLDQEALVIQSEHELLQCKRRIQLKSQGNVIHLLDESPQEAKKEVTLPSLPPLKKEEPLLKLLNLSMQFETPVFEALNATFQQGEIVGIFGNNGSGKSTLFQILRGLLKPSKGSFWKAKTTSITLLQTHTFYHLFQRTALEAVFGDASLLPHGVRPESSPLRLSEGQKRQLAFSSLAARDFDIYLLDEPFSGLDEQSLIWLLQKIHGLALKGKLILISTHQEAPLKALNATNYTLKKDGFERKFL